MNYLNHSSARQIARIWLMALISGWAFGLRIIGLGRQSLWYDEAFSLAVARADWSTFWAALLSDAVHPPGYYFLLRGSLALFGQSEFALRFPSVLAGVLATPLIYQLGCKLGGRRWGVVAALMLAANPFALWYAQEARMYSLLLGLAIASSYAFWQLLTRPGRRAWLALTLVAAVSFISHYFAFLVSLGQFVHLALHLRQTPRSLRWWTLAQAVAFLPFLPWAVAVAFREGRNFGIGWIHPVSLLDMPLTLSNLALLLSNPASPWTWLGLSLIVGAGGMGVIRLNRRAAGKSNPGVFQGSGRDFTAPASMGSAFLLVWLLLPVVFVWLISLRLPLYVDRQFIICLPALILLSSAVTLGPSWPARGLVMLLILASLAASARLWLDPGLAKEDWRRAAATVEQLEQAHDALLMRDFQTGIPFSYYYRGQLHAHALSLNRDTTPPEILTAGHDRAWLVYRRPFEPTHEVAGAQPFTWQDEADPVVRAWLVANEAKLKQEITLPGVYLVLYEW